MQYQLTLFEYNLNIYYVFEKKLAIVDNLSRISKLLLIDLSSIKISLVFFVIKSFEITKNIVVLLKTIEFNSTNNEEISLT